MITKIRAGIKTIFNYIKRIDLFKRKDVETLEEATSKTVEERSKRENDLAKVNLDYMNNPMSLEEYAENRKKIECYETHVNIRSDKIIIDRFFEKGLFREDKKGIFIAEPFWHSVFNFIDESEVVLNKKRKKFLKNKVTEISSFLDIIHPLNERKYLMDDIAMLIGQESSLLFTNTPSIFNPFEFEKKYENFTLSFSSAIIDTSQPTYYIWNENAVLDEIIAHVRDWSGTRDELIQLYFDHFIKYKKNNKVQIYWGDSSLFTKSDLSLPYISENQLIIGVREKGKLIGGVRININSIRQTMSTFPFVGRFANMSPSVINALMGFPAFEKIRGNLVDKFNFKKFEGNTTIEIIRFIEQWIDKAYRILNINGKTRLIE
jgi:hypothetical protein